MSQAMDSYRYSNVALRVTARYSNDMLTNVERQAALRSRRKSTRDRLDALATSRGFVRVPDALVYANADGKVMTFREDGTRL